MKLDRRGLVAARSRCGRRRSAGRRGAATKAQSAADRMRPISARGATIGAIIVIGYRLSAVLPALLLRAAHYYRPYPYSVPAPFPFGFGFGPFWW